MKPSSPCVSLLLSLLAPVVGFTSASAADYVADGVDTGDLTSSTRFYDTGKGLYWEVTGQPYNGAKQLYGQYGKSFAFLGDLQSRIKGTEFKPEAFDNLTQDASACWFCVGANVIQYWESYYGVFYKGDEPLPYGYTYHKDHLATLGGTQSLDIHMSFYDSWGADNPMSVGGDGEMAIVWYLATGKNIYEGKANYYQLKDDAPCKGAFFSEYFTDNAASREAYYMGSDISDLRSASDFLMDAFGFDKEGNQVTYGQIAYVGVLTEYETGENPQGHALTCYGFTLGKNGLLESLYLTNSDDKEYKVFQAYVGLNDAGFLHLYEDAAHTRDWTYAGMTWNICDITYINTPLVLKVMYDEYSRAALTWTGTVDTWSGADASKATTETLPDDQTGWKAYAQDDYYASYYQAGRTVEFSDLAAKTNVTLQGKLSTPELRLTNNTKAYTFSGASGTTLHADFITKQGAADVTFSNVAITAKAVDVDMGALILGKNAALTAGSGEVDDMGTLQLSGGQASFTGSLDIYSSATLAVTTAAQLTSTLNLHDGSALYFNLGSGNKTSPLLTLTGDLNVLGTCHLAVNNAALTNEQVYILASVSGNITGWQDIISNCGSVFLTGNQLVLECYKPDTLTWTGGSGTWSASQWDGRTEYCNFMDVIFAPQSGKADITVVGDVFPNSIHFSRGEYRLIAGAGAGTSGCHTITLGSGASIIATVPLTGGNITMESGSSLTMALTTPESEVTGLEMAPGSSLVFQGATRYTVNKAGALAGNIELKGTTVLVLGSSLDTELYGSYSGDAGTAIVLMNSSDDHPVTFYMGQGSPGFKGSVTIGTGDDAPLTTLRMGYAARNFTITENGELSLRGTGEITGFMDGTGTLTIERDAIYQLAPGGKVSFSKDVALNVAGIATAGTADHPLKAALQDRIAVSGSLTVYYQAEEGKDHLTLNELALNNSGAYTLVHLERTVYSLHTIDKLTVDGGGSLTNSVMSVEKETSAQYRHDIIINTLSGSGTLDLQTSSDVFVTKTIIKDTASGGYNGDIVIYNPHYYKSFYYANYDHGQVVEMNSGTIKGAVRLEAHGMVSDDQAKQYPLSPYGLAGFGVSGDITVGGIDDTESSKTTYLYSGSYDAAVASKDPAYGLFADNILPERHTLTINAAEDYEFHGQVFGWLSLKKQGSGTQVFSGDTSIFEGALNVSGGELAFSNAIGSATAVTLNGGTLRLHGGNLAGLGGSGGTLALETGSYNINLTGSTGSYAVQLNGTTANVTGSGPFGGSITTTGKSGITVESGNTLTLASAITNSGTLTLKGCFDASALTLIDTADTHVNTEGKYGDSGFSMKGGSFVSIVSGGTTVDGGATITHSKLKEGTLKLNANGIASTGESTVDYTAYLLTGTDTASVSAINKAAGTALKTINVEGGTLTVDAATTALNATGGKVSITQNVAVGGSAKNTAITATAGTLNTALSGTTTIAKSGTGTLTIGRANTHTGKTTVSGGTLKVTDKDALGTGAVQLSGGTLQIAANGFGNTITSSGTSGITVDAPNTLVLANALSNQGTLTLRGSFDASTLTLTQGQSTHVDASGKTGNSGFTKSGVSSVTIVTGGTTVNGGATIIHSGLKEGELTLGTDGKAVSDGVVDYTAYLLTGTDTASVSAINKAAGTALKTINVEGGTLTVDAATTALNATGGKVSITQNVTVGGSAKNTAITATAGTLNTALSGTTTIAKSGTGTLTIGRANTHTGKTTVSGGTLKVTDKDALGTGAVQLSGGTLQIAANGFGNTITSSGTSGITVADTNTLTLKQAIQNTGTLTLRGALDASALELSHDDSTHVDINGKTGASGFTKSGSYSVSIVTGGTIKDGGATIIHSGLQEGELTLGTDGKATCGGVVDYTAYLLTGKDSASVSAITKAAGTALKAINMEGGTLTVDATTDKLGSISGNGTINVSPNTKLTINRANNGYTGETWVYNGGELQVGDAHALGSGTVHLSCGTLKIADGDFSNKISTTCSGSVVNVLGDALRMQQAIANSGTVTLIGAFDASALTLSQGETTHVDVNGKTGASGFTKSGGYSVTIVEGGTIKNGGATITHSGLKSGETLTLGTDGKATSGGTVDHSTYLLTGKDTASVSSITKAAGTALKAINVEGGTLTVDAATTALNATGGTLEIQKGVNVGGTLANTALTSEGGTINATLSGTSSLTVTGGNVELTKTNTHTGDTTVQDATLTAGANGAFGSSTVTLESGTVNLNGKDQADSTINVTGEARLQAGTNGTVKALKLSTDGGADGQNGELLFAEELALTGTLKTGTLSLVRGNISGGGITVSGATTVQQGYIGNDISGTTLAKTGAARAELGGKNSFTGGATVQQGALALLENSSMSANITVKNGASLLTAINVAGNITLESGATMRLRPGDTYSLTRGLTSTTGAAFHGNLTTGSGSVLTLTTNGTGAALSVHGNVTLASGSASASGTWNSGTYKLIEALDGGAIDSRGKDLNTYFNLDKGTYTLTNTGSAITLVKKAPSLTLQRMAGSRVVAGADGNLTLEDAPITEALAAGVADALVQADWGTVNAGRAFNGTLNGRHQSLRAICNGRTAVWVNALGSGTRQSSAHGHAGADHNLYGGVFGVEFNAGAHGAAGLAIGHTWNRVNTFGTNRISQDTGHAGAFGRARLYAGGSNALWLEASAAYGKTDSRGTLGVAREHWSQNGCTLNVRANDVWQVNDETALNFFGGLEYAATDSGSIDELHTGSVQNLRGEIGAGVTRTIGRGMMYAEAALQGDMVRHNPQADVGIRRGGANPGRIGGSISVGGAYIINAHWSVNASYTFEGAKHNNSHNIDAGATFRF